MANTTTVELLFCCPACGAEMRACRRDSGSVLDCQICGEHIRVPHHPHPVESPESLATFAPARIFENAERGLKALQFSLFLLVAEYLVLAIVYAIWLQASGAPAVLRRDSSAFGNLLIIGWAIELVIMLARTGVRWWGYSLCEGLAQQLGMQGWVAISRYSTLLRAAGYTLLALPWLMHAVWPLEGLLAAAAKIGQFAWIVGVGLEFAVLVPWYHILNQFEGNTTAKEVIRYALKCIVGLFVSAVGVVVMAILFVITIRSQPGNQNLPRGPLNLAELPDSLWTASGTMLLVVGLYWLYLSVLHYRILSTIRESIRSRIVVSQEMD
jgi:hypothetical protein